MSTPPVDDEHIVCECMQIGYAEIVQAVKEGHCDLQSLMDATDAGTVCGRCKSAEEDPAGERTIHLDEILRFVRRSGAYPEE